MELGNVVQTTSSRSPEERASKLLSLDWLPEGFRERLTAESGWHPDDVDAALVEYARFILLAVTEPKGATPSKAVDAVWHLHLMYTQDYWETLCRGTLERPLHHHPGRGLPGETQHFQRRYAETLEAYERTFGETPPTRIWPRAATPAADPDIAPAEPTAAHPIRQGGGRLRRLIQRLAGADLEHAT